MLLFVSIRTAFPGMNRTAMPLLTSAGTDRRLTAASGVTRVSDNVTSMGPLSPCHVTGRTPISSAEIVESSARLIETLQYSLFLTRCTYGVMCEVVPESSSILSAERFGFRDFVLAMAARCDFCPFDFFFLPFVRCSSADSSSESVFFFTFLPLPLAFFLRPSLLFGFSGLTQQSSCVCPSRPQKSHSTVARLA